MNGNAQLIWMNDDRPPFALQKIITTIGRNEANDILLDDPKVSSFHSNILHREDGYHLLDMKSRNGTFVNGKKVSVHALREGDCIEFGEIKLRFRAQPLLPKASPPLARLNQKIQTIAVSSPSLRKDAEEILVEVEKHQRFLHALVDASASLAECQGLEHLAAKLHQALAKLLDCGNLEMFAEAGLPEERRRGLEPGMAARLEEWRGGPDAAGGRVCKYDPEGGGAAWLAFLPSPDLGWVAFRATGLAAPKEDATDLADVVLLFASVLWRNLARIDELHRQETARAVEEKDRESRQRISHLERQNQKLDSFVQQTRNRLVFADGSPMERVFELARKLATVDLPVLITGETGTGKTYIAQLLHHFSARAQQGCYTIDCATIPSNLIESELFGYEKGAFTGAAARKIGKVEAASGGTLFLDEIGDLPLELQGKLLRFVQEGKLERVGGTETMKVDVRIIAATNYDLEERVKAGKFRQDLFFRLHVLPLHVPPLRERVGDIPILAKHFIAKHFGGNEWSFTPDALEAIRQHGWPGNVRELENKLQRAWIFHAHDVITAADLGLGPHFPSLDGADAELELERKTLEQYREEFEGAILMRCLRHYKGNITKCAEHLEISRNTCKSMIRKYRIAIPTWERAA